MRRFVFGVSLLLLTACDGTRTSAQSASGAQPTPGGNEVVAELGGRKITLAELDQKWKALDPAEQARVSQLLYQNRRTVLDQMIGDLLIEDAAKAAGVAPQQFLQQEIQKRAKPVGDADVQGFFEQNKDRTQGRTLEQLRGPIQEFLKGQREQQARAQLLDDLKKKRTADVHVLLEPPRQTVELALHDPSLGPANAPVTLVEFSDYQ